jgi:peptidoglycan/LPS O-acetylase OafA/YrhL
VLGVGRLHPSAGLDRPAGQLTLQQRLNPRANSLNAFRLVLATTVIVSHSYSLGGYGPTPTHGGWTAGGWAVDAFFCLSGYLIAASRFNTSAWEYLRRRVLRIYPGFLACLLAVVVIFAPVSYYHLHGSLSGYLTTPHTPGSYLLHNLGLKMHVPSVAGTPSSGAWAGTLWTLYFEFLCYLIIGLLACWATFRRRPAVAVALFAATTIVGLGNASVARHTDGANLARLLPFFLAGTAVYMLRDRIPATWWLAVAAAVTLVVIPFAGPRFVVLCALPLTYLLLYLGAVIPAGLGRTNDWSYGIYMYGYPVEQMARYLHLGSQTIYVIVSIAATLPFAALSWFLIEKRAMQWRTGRRKDAQPVPAFAAAGHETSVREITTGLARAAPSDEDEAA